MINKLIVQGRLVRDVEIKKTQSGVSIARFTVAWSEKYKDIEKQCFVTCKAFSGTADFIGKYFTKGKEILVEGKLITESYEKDGEKKNTTLMHVDAAHFCGGKSEGGNAQQTAKSAEGNFVQVDEELPF